MTLMYEPGIEQPRTTTARVKKLRIATYNLHGAVGIDGRFLPERISDVLAEIDADIFTLQEVPLGGAHAPNVLDALQRMTKLHAVAGPTLDLSFRSREPRGALDADIDCGGKTWRVVATHLGLASGERRAQVEQVLQTFDTPALPVILLGDLNEWFVYGRTLRRFVTHFHRASALRTFPTRYPLFALGSHLGASGRTAAARGRASLVAVTRGIGSLSADCSHQRTDRRVRFIDRCVMDAFEHVSKDASNAI